MIKNRRAIMKKAAQNPSKFDVAVKKGATNFVNNMKSMPQAFKTVGSQIKAKLSAKPTTRRRKRII